MEKNKIISTKKKKKNDIPLKTDFGGTKYYLSINFP
jgi:hypothetical protein